MSEKKTLHLYINSELVDLAKNSNLNLSAEFEEWIRIRLGNINEDKPVVDIDLEIAKYRSEILKLQNQAELDKQFENKEQEEIMVLDGIIDNERDTIKKNHPDKTWDEIAEERINGVIFLFSKKFNKPLNRMEAKELFIKRIKERELL
jgi:hypothetical protein